MDHREVLRDLLVVERHEKISKFEIHLVSMPGIECPDSFVSIHPLSMSRVLQMLV
jgi:hypothetical protein